MARSDERETGDVTAKAWVRRAGGEVSSGGGCHPRRVERLFAGFQLSKPVSLLAEHIFELSRAYFQVITPINGEYLLYIIFDIFLVIYH